MFLALLSPLLLAPSLVLGVEPQLLGSPPVPADGSVSPASFLFYTYWEWRLQQSPEFASFAGTRTHNGQLETFTFERFADDLYSSEDFLLQAEDLLNSTTDERDRLNLEFFKGELKPYIEGFPFHGFYYPVSYLEGVQVDFQRLSEWVSLDTIEDYRDLTKRYYAFGDYMAQLIGMLRRGIKEGQTNHNVSMAGVLEQVAGHTSPTAEETVFFEPFLDLDLALGEDGRLVQAEAKAAIQMVIQPSFRAFAEFLQLEYLPNTRPEIAASSIGSGYYEACLAFHTTTNKTAEEIHNIGLSEVDRIEEEMLLIVREMGYEDLTLQEFTEMIRTDPANFFDSPEELLQAFHDIIEGQIDGKLLEIFHNKPKTALEIVPMPPSQSNGPAAFYSSGTPDGSRPGRLYVNTNKYNSQPRYEMVSLSLHETNPGHHLQGSYSIEQADWPMFRKIMEDRIYSQAPSRFPINTGYVEGWALYSEGLGYDIDMYGNPLDSFGHLSEEIFRACRLVVDTGMHALGWTQEEAVQYMLEHTAASEENIRNEVTRYITWPGQATAYKIGQLKIEELRKRAFEELGENFNIKDFHDVVLRSVGPLDMLEEQVNLYIATHRKSI